MLLLLLLLLLLKRWSNEKKCQLAQRRDTRTEKGAVALPHNTKATTSARQQNMCQTPDILRNINNTHRTYFSLKLHWNVKQQQRHKHTHTHSHTHNFKAVYAQVAFVISLIIAFELESSTAPWTCPAISAYFVNANDKTVESLKERHSWLNDTL